MVTDSTVSEARRKHAADTVGKSSAASNAVPKHIDWGAVDWNRANRDLAKEHGVNHSSVSYARHKFAPKTVGRFRAPRGRPFDPNVHSHEPIDWSVVRWDRSDNAIARELRTSNVTVAKYRRIHARETVGVYKEGTKSSETAAFRLAYTGRQPTRS
jgi:hypothetical protein